MTSQPTIRLAFEIGPSTRYQNKLATLTMMIWSIAKTNQHDTSHLLQAGGMPL